MVLDSYASENLHFVLVSMLWVPIASVVIAVAAVELQVRPVAAFAPAVESPVAVADTIETTLSVAETVPPFGFELLLRPSWKLCHFVACPPILSPYLSVVEKGCWTLCCVLCSPVPAVVLTLALSLRRPQLLSLLLGLLPPAQALLAANAPVLVRGLVCGVQLVLQVGAELGSSSS